MTDEELLQRAEEYAAKAIRGGKDEEGRPVNQKVCAIISSCCSQLVIARNSLQVDVVQEVNQPPRVNRPPIVPSKQSGVLGDRI